MTLALDKHIPRELSCQPMFIRKRSTVTEQNMVGGGRLPNNTDAAAYRRSSLGSRALILLIGCVRTLVTFIDLMRVIVFEGN